MLIKRLALGAGLACVLGVMAGCSTAPTTTDTSSTSGMDDSNVTTGVGGGGDLSGSTMEDTRAMEAPLDTVFYFEFDEAILKPEAREALSSHAQRLSASPRSVRLEGHADERGTREYNMALGERRANAVRDFLVIQGVSANTIEVVSYGEERPADACHAETCWWKNRRVELK